MNSSRFGPNPSQTVANHWVPLKVVLRRVLTENQQLRPSYTQYYVGAETTFQNLNHLDLRNALPVVLLSGVA